MNQRSMNWMSGVPAVVALHLSSTSCTLPVGTGEDAADAVERCRALAWVSSNGLRDADAFVGWDAGVQICEEALALAAEDPVALAAYWRALYKTEQHPQASALEAMRRAAASGHPYGQFGMRVLAQRRAPEVWRLVSVRGDTVKVSGNAWRRIVGECRCAGSSVSRSRPGQLLIGQWAVPTGSGLSCCGSIPGALVAQPYARPRRAFRRERERRVGQLSVQSPQHQHQRDPDSVARLPRSRQSDSEVAPLPRRLSARRQPVRGEAAVIPSLRPATGSLAPTARAFVSGRHKLARNSDVRVTWSAVSVGSVAGSAGGLGVTSCAEPSVTGSSLAIGLP